MATVKSYQEHTPSLLKCECQKDLNVYYKNKIVGTYRTDMIVEDAIILELKAVSALRPEHEWQLVNYLKGTNLQVGLLLNFGLRAEMKRKILTRRKP